MLDLVRRAEMGNHASDRQDIEQSYASLLTGLDWAYIVSQTAWLKRGCWETVLECYRSC
jgi:hypothetical protein